MADPTSKAEEIEVEEMVDAQGDGAENVSASEVATQLMKNPQVLAAIQGKLGSMVGAPSGYIQSLPKVVKRRLKSLKKLQFKTIEIESKFYEEVHELECKYASQFAPLYERRKEVVNGAIEPTDSDCDWPSDEEEEDEEDEDRLASKAIVNEVDETKEKQDKESAEKKEKEEENVSGVPEFWLTIFKNVEMLSEMIQEHDEPILKHLKDIKVVFLQSNPMGFKLEFYFSANEYFANTLLTKEYVMRCEPDEGDPFSYEGPEIIKCKGCTVDWMKGKDVTVKLIKKTQKHRGRGTKRIVTKTVQNDSFFNFFSPPEVPEGEIPDEETETLLGADFEIGHFLRERVVPRAILYFTGEALEDDEDDDYDEEGEEEENDDEDGDYDEDADADFAPGKDAEKPADCKQQ